MSAVTHRGTTTDTTDGTSFVSGSFTPVAGQLVVVFVTSRGTQGITPTMTDSMGLGFTRVAGFGWPVIPSGRLDCFVSNALAGSGSMTVTFDTTGATCTGVVIHASSVTEMTRTGAAAVRQSAQAAGAGGATPTPTFGHATAVDTPKLGVVANNTNPATMTAPSGWTESSDTGFATPTSGSEFARRNTGGTAAAIARGNTSATNWGALVVELDNTETNKFEQKVMDIGTPGLYWRMDETDTVAVDRSGNWRNGVYNGTYVQSEAGAYGTDDSVKITDPPVDGTGVLADTYAPFAADSKRTFVCFVKRDGDENFDVILSGDGASNQHPVLELVSGANTVRWYQNVTAQFPGGGNDWANAGPATGGGWTLLGLNVDDDALTVELFRNGHSMGLQTLSASYHASSGLFQVGARGAAQTEVWNGWIDEVIVYGRLLTASEHKELARAGGFVAGDPATRAGAATAGAELKDALGSPAPRAGAAQVGTGAKAVAGSTPATRAATPPSGVIDRLVAGASPALRAATAKIGATAWAYEGAPATRAAGASAGSVLKKYLGGFATRTATAPSGGILSAFHRAHLYRSLYRVRALKRTLWPSPR